MKITSYILFVCCLVIMSCDDHKKSTSKAETTENTSEDKKISAKTIENLDFKDYALSSDGQKIVVSWEKYKELETQLSFLKKADFSFFNGDIEVLKTFIKEFKAEMPDDFRTNPIQSRNVIIETSLLRLNEYLTLDNIERDDKINGIKEVFIAYSNLNYQINKKLERDEYSKIQPE